MILKACSSKILKNDANLKKLSSELGQGGSGSGGES